MVRVVMMEQLRLDEWKEKSMKENDWNETDAMKHEVDSKESDAPFVILDRKIREVER